MGYYFEDMQDGYSCKDTILTYDLEEWQFDLLKEVVKVEKIKGRQLKFFVAENIIDCVATPYLIAFLNFADVSDEDKQMFFDTWLECNTPLKIRDDVDNEERKLIEECNSIRMRPTYILNCGNNKLGITPHLYLDSKIFADKEKLRLTVLHEVKKTEQAKSGENEFDWGWRSDKGSSMKLRRLLLIYRQLLCEGWITKEIVDKLCREHGLDPVSIRSFMRDLEIIRSIGEVVGWNKDKKRYEYGRKTYTHTDNAFL